MFVTAVLKGELPCTKCLFEPREAAVCLVPACVSAVHATKPRLSLSHFVASLHLATLQLGLKRADFARAQAHVSFMSLNVLLCVMLVICCYRMVVNSSLLM